ncbi:MAG: hypothetical protein KKC46_00750 [Proteobacteria bacterium]|nr:hypothetical protein [Pseudomonadota bacterium]
MRQYCPGLDPGNKNSFSIAVVNILMNCGERKQEKSVFISDIVNNI